MVLFLIGADGNDLFSLTSFLSEFIPEVSFIAPNAPFECPFSTGGRQWFSIDQIDKGWLTDMSDFVNNTLKPNGVMQNSLAAATYKGKIYAAPITIGCPVLHWNKNCAIAFS